jgi:hypothetical protein
MRDVTLERKGWAAMTLAAAHVIAESIALVLRFDDRAP